MSELGKNRSGDKSTAKHDAAVRDAEPERGPQQLGFQFDFRKVAELGRGGQGVVHLVEGKDSFSAQRALKIFRPGVYDSEASFRADMERMRRVARMIHRAPHDDLVEITWFGEHEDNFALMMQYIDGFDLRRLVQPDLLPRIRQRVDEDRWRTINSVVYAEQHHQFLALQPAIAVYIIERVLRGLSALHTRGIVYGDIKPSNIMLNSSGFVKIIDIGSAFETNAPPREYYVTPAYAAPEFHERKEVTIRSDLASVGYVLIELLSGRSIIDAPSDPDETTRTIGRMREKKLLEIKTELPDRLTEILPGRILGSTYLQNLCRRLVDPDPQKRFLDANDSIVDPNGGTYAFYQDLMRANLATCNFHEASYWLTDVKRATSERIEPTANFNTPLPSRGEVG